MTRVFALDCSVFSDEGLFRVFYGMMSPERRAKIDFYRFEKDRYLSLGAGVLLEYGLGLYGKSGAPVSCGENGKPSIEGLYFNLTHSGTLAAASFSDMETGIDAELLTEVSEELAAGVCVPSELRHIMAITDKNVREREFFRLWTAKESFMKKLGTGLSLHPKELEVVFGERLTLIQGVSSARYFFREYSLSDYCLTVCGEEDDFSELYFLRLTGRGKCDIM